MPRHAARSGRRSKRVSNSATRDILQAYIMEVLGIIDVVLMQAHRPDLIAGIFAEMIHFVIVRIHEAKFGWQRRRDKVLPASVAPASNFSPCGRVVNGVAP